jgi:uncharacterized protein (DUF58 family)
LKRLRALRPRVAFALWWDARLLRLRWRSDTTYIVPTPAGLALLGGALAIFLLAALYRNDILYVHGFALLSLFFLGMILTHGNLRRVRVEAHPVADVFEGSEISFAARVVNGTKAGAALLRVRVVPGARAVPRVKRGSRGKRVEQKSGSTPRSLEEASANACNDEAIAAFGPPGPAEAVVYLPAHSTTISRTPSRALARGRCGPMAAFVTTRAPLGLFLAWRVFPLRYDACVLPEPRGRLPLPRAAEGADGEAGDGRRPVGLEIDGLRPLRPGDPIVRAAWRRFTPRSLPVVRVTASDARRRAHLTWEEASRAGDREAALSQLTAWLLACRQAGHSCSLQTPSLRVEELDDAAYDRALRSLAVFPRAEGRASG